MVDATAHVKPGGPALDRTLPLPDTTARVRKLSVGSMDNNVYILTDTASARSVLIDAANDAPRILNEVSDVVLEGILTTHGHADHWQALGEVAEATGAPTFIHPDDAEMLPLTPDRELADEMTLTFGGVTVEMIHTPGHTPGSTCVLLRGGATNYLFSGDTLFPGGPGNTFGDAQAFSTIMKSLRERLFTLPDETIVCPGHGDGTTLGAERPQLEEWQARGW